jgi:PAS domain S-box-containing protein
MNLMNSAVYISLFSAIFTAFIGIYVFLLNPKKITNRVFAVFVLFLAIFSISEFMTRVSETQELALLFGRICYSIFPLISCLGVHFSLVFPKKYSKNNNIFSINKSILLFLYIVSIIAAIIFNQSFSIQDVKMSEWGYRVILNPPTEFIIYWLLVCSSIATFSLAHTYFKKYISTNEKKQIQFVTIGLLLVVALSLGTNLIPPLYGVSVFPMTTVSLAIFSFFVAFSMRRYRLMKLTTAETADVVINTMVDSLLVIDGNNTIVNVNKSTLGLLGYNRKELMNVSLEFIVNLPHFESNVLSKVHVDGRIKDTETEFFTKERKSIPMNISASSIYNDRRELEGIVIVARDLTETKNFIKKLEEAKNNLEKHVIERTAELEKSKRRIELQNIKLKKLDQMKSEFLNITSHELRTPMSAIKGYIQILLKQTLGNITSEQKDALNIALRNTDRLDHLVQEILDISNLESGTMKFIPEKTDIAKMIKDVIETMQSSADMKNIKINTKLEKTPEIAIDQERITQVLMNLIGNSIKFSPQHSTINLYTRMKKDEVLFEVQDFGRGIPKKKQKKIFEKFYQVDTGMDRKFGGVGLGLTISQGIIRAHGGKIWVDSTLGKGSTFKFSIPSQSIKNTENRFKKKIDIFELEK